MNAEDLPSALLVFVQRKPYSYSEISRRMGFRSRSHVREIAERKKPVPKGFASALAKAFRMNSTWCRYFECLQRPSEVANLKQARQKAQKSLEKREMKGGSHTAHAILSHPEFPVVFAALGDPDVGANLEEIHKRTSISVHRLRDLLAGLIRSGVVCEDQNRFKAAANHIVLSALGETNYFQTDLIRALERAKTHVKRADPARTLYFNSTFCVRESDLPRLRAELNNVLLSFVDAAETSNGDKIVQLVTALT